MEHRLDVVTVTHGEWAVRLDGRLLGHAVLDLDATCERWAWWVDGGGVVPQHESTREMAVYRLVVGAGGLDFATARSLVTHAEPVAA